MLEISLLIQKQSYCLKIVYALNKILKDTNEIFKGFKFKLSTKDLELNSLGIDSTLEYTVNMYCIRHVTTHKKAVQSQKVDLERYIKKLKSFKLRLSTKNI